MMTRCTRMFTALAGLTVVVLLAGCTTDESAGGQRPIAASPADPERVAGLQPCDIPVEILERVSHGYKPGRSGDVLTIEWEPNQFKGVRHSTPWDYTQEVPLVLYGPGYIRSGVTARRDATVADLAPTYAELLNFDAWPARDGTVLQEALLPPERRNGVPRLIFTLVWDGGGDNLLQQWPDAWPELEQVMSSGASFDNATVGSSPSITPAIHTNMGTGSFPAAHGITDMKIRVDGRMQFAWPNASPRYLQQTTLADEWDLANGNAPLVGMMARDSYHLGMIGHGASIAGADHDIMAMTGAEGNVFETNENFYELPSYLTGVDGLTDALAELDSRDGRADSKWRGHDLDADDPFLQYTPAWPIYQTGRIDQLLSTEGFGSDDVPDLFYTNYKTTDLAGHFFNLIEPEEEEVLREQDRQLAALVELLDDLVGERSYVLVLTADHGITPYPTETGGWPIDGAEVASDIDATLSDGKESIVLSHRGYQIFLEQDAMAAAGVTSGDVTEFLRNYRIKDNIVAGDEAPDSFARKLDERLFLTALTPARLRQVLTCARKRS